MNLKTRQWRASASSHSAGELLVPWKERAVTLCAPVALVIRGSWVIFANTSTAQQNATLSHGVSGGSQEKTDYRQLNHRGEKQALCLPSDSYGDLETFCFPISHLSSALMVEEHSLFHFISQQNTPWRIFSLFFIQIRAIKQQKKSIDFEHRDPFS